ncbi:MAG TPA: 4'-phosphopantetheinyl transferase superfamily protein [Thermoanaerobaculia bacterium]
MIAPLGGIPVGWLTADGPQAPADDGWLSPKERVRLATLQVPARRADWRLGRWTAKHAVAAYLDAGFEAVEIRPAADGAPEALLGGEPAPVSLSFSHRAGRAACAVAPAGTALGCDLGLVEPRSAAFVRDYLTAAEQALVRAAPEMDHPLLVNLIWSAKECALKALRAGLRLDTRSVEVRLPEDGESAGWRPFAVHARETGEDFAGWWRRDGGWVLTLAASPPPALPRHLLDRAPERG